MRRFVPGLALVLLGTLAGCSMPGPEVVRDVSAETAPDPSAVDSRFAVADPGPLNGPPLSADLLVMANRTLPKSLRDSVDRTRGVRVAAPLSLASVPVSGRSITIGAVDPSSYRRFTPRKTASMDAVWQRVAAGDVALTQQLGADLGVHLGGGVALGNSEGALSLRVGAYASMAPRIDAVVNEPRGRQLGMRPDNAMLVSTGGRDADDVATDLRALVGKRVVVQPLDVTVPPTGAVQAAYLTGGSVAQAVGSFGYRYFRDGSIEPDAAWVAANIRSQSMPILGSVTCHRVLLPQLYGALAEVERTGLAGLVDAQEFGGCYVPRFIDRDPTRGVSLHTWGIAVDLNVATNQLGTAGQMDPRVVAIFARWGFAWGGTWQRPDPMHFELASLVRPTG